MTSTIREAWYSVETPSIFVERKLPVDDTHRTPLETAEFKRLEDLAERHATRITVTSYRRG